MKRFITLLLIAVFGCLAAGTVIYYYRIQQDYNINSGFTAVPLQYNPDDASSVYTFHGARITVYNGFIKGVQNRGKDGDSLVIRALSPLPAIELTAGQTPVENLLITVENVNPDFYAPRIGTGLNLVKISANSLMMSLNLAASEIKHIEPDPPNAAESGNYVILGDSRDGYDTFSNMLNQVNGLKPVFVIDNGDLVFSGRPNQYRLFDKSASTLSVTLCTTLGNHDIRKDGKRIYAKLYGPSYYSFDYGNSHFAFLDSSPGWVETRAISEEQYAWLERDLKRAQAQGKQIYVISHIPPIDPRTEKTPNEIQTYIDKAKSGNSYWERMLEQYMDNQAVDHGFRDKQEAQRFISLMTSYHVDTVYLSHIHSYFDYTQDGVRYIISGGAGAELLTNNSYYHYLIAKLGVRDAITMVQLPSPANNAVSRLAYTVTLFAKAIYVENKAAVLFILFGLFLFVLLLLMLIYMRIKRWLTLVWTVIKDAAKYIVLRWKQLFKGTS